MPSFELPPTQFFSSQKLFRYMKFTTLENLQFVKKQIFPNALCTKSCFRISCYIEFMEHEKCKNLSVKICGLQKTDVADFCRIQELCALICATQSSSSPSWFWNVKYNMEMKIGKKLQKIIIWRIRLLAQSCNLLLLHVIWEKKTAMKHFSFWSTAWSAKNTKLLLAV